MIDGPEVDYISAAPHILSVWLPLYYSSNIYYILYSIFYIILYYIPVYYYYKYYFSEVSVLIS